MLTNKEEVPLGKGYDDILEGYERASNILNFLYEKKKLSIPKFILDRKKEIGTNVHEAIAEYIAMRTIKTDLTETEYMYFESWRAWFHKGDQLGMCKKIEHVETRLYDSDRMITGCLDGILVQNEKRYIVDWKTSVAIDRLSWPAKSAIYAQLVRRNELCDISDDVCFIKMLKTGEEAVEVWFSLTEFHFEFVNWAVDCYE